MSDEAPQEPPKSGRPPDFNVSALVKSTDHKGRVGAGWVNADGTITVKLNPFVVLSAAQDTLITLFPADKPFKKKSAPPPETPPTY